MICLTLKICEFVTTLNFFRSQKIKKKKKIGLLNNILDPLKQKEKAHENFIELKFERGVACNSINNKTIVQQFQNMKTRKKKNCKT